MPSSPVSAGLVFAALLTTVSPLAGVIVAAVLWAVEVIFFIVAGGGQDGVG
jgi:hypothetical protein